MVAPLRIAHVTATFPPYRGGTGNVCYYNARELVRRGHEVHVFTATVEGAPEHEMCEGIRIHRMRPLVRVGNAPLLAQVLPILRGFDIIHLHLPFIGGGELTSYSAAFHQIPLVVTYHSDLVSDGSWRDHVFRMATWSSRNTVLLRADAVLFVSEGHAETCEQHIVYEKRRKHCHILPNGVDTKLFQPDPDNEATRHHLGLEPDRPLVGFVGVLDRAHHYKGLEVLMAALANAAFDQVQLLVVGDGELKEHYQHKTKDLNLSSRTVFFGTAEHEELPSLLQACDVLSVPSIVPESFGLVIAEAFACSVPVVASDCPGVRSLVEHGVNGWLTPAGDVSLLHHGLMTLLTMPPEQRTAMGQAGRRKVERHYAWEHIGMQLEQIYVSVMTSAPSAVIGYV